MPDLSARKDYARTLRAYFTGRITNRQYEERIPLGDHPAIDYFEHNFVWYEYDDARTHTHSFKNLAPEGKETLKRMMLFLYSDLPFEWPVFVSKRPVFLNWLTFGWAGRRYDERKFAFDSHGSMDTFPFRNEDDLLAELAKPRAGLSLRIQT